MDDEKIISDRSLEIDQEEQAARRHASQLPSVERDTGTDTGTTLAGDTFRGAVAGPGEAARTGPVGNPMGDAQSDVIEGDLDDANPETADTEK